MTILRSKRTWTMASLCVLVGYAACTLDNPDAGDFTGPSTTGMSLEMRAVPDRLVSDGFSSSIIEAVMRGPDGERVPGIEIEFDISAGGVFLDLGNLAPVNGPRPTFQGVESGPVTAVTGDGGVARARYWAPFRSDQENDTTVNVTGRQVSTNFRSNTIRRVTIFLRAANRPSFPGSTFCSFIIEPQGNAYKPGQVLNFTGTQDVGPAGFPIARFEWDFGDGSGLFEGRNATHVYKTVGVTTDADGNTTFEVTLYTTESITGTQSSCTETIIVNATGIGPAPEDP